MCEEKDAEIDAEISRLAATQKKLASQSDDLKKQLYTKFGNQIMLDEN